MSAPYRRPGEYHRSPEMRRLDFEPRFPFGQLGKGELTRGARKALQLKRAEAHKEALAARPTAASIAGNRARIAQLKADGQPLPGQATDPTFRH